MPVKKRIAKGRQHRITSEAVEAYREGDYFRLHAALGLGPWQPSPLPLEIEGLGVDQDDPPAWIAREPHWLADYRLAQELQRELEKAAKAN